MLAPRIIHFIWLGKPIPEAYLLSILRLNSHLLAARDIKIQVILWCDKLMHIYATAARLSLHGLEDKLCIKTFKDDLFPAMRFDPFYGKELGLKRWQRFHFFRKLESIGAHNYATVADLLRLEILRQFGGCYCDVDTVFSFPVGIYSHITDEHLPVGFKLNLSLGAHRYGLGEGQIFYFSTASLGNDVIVALPNTDFIKKAICNLLLRLHSWFSHSLQKYKYDDDDSYFSLYSISTSVFSCTEDKPKFPYDVKRCMLFEYKSKYNRRSLTIKCGPGIILETARAHLDAAWQRLKSIDDTISLAGFERFFGDISVHAREYSLHHTPQVLINPNKEGRCKITGEHIQVFGIKMRSQSDLNWLVDCVESKQKGIARPRAYTI